MLLSFSIANHLNWDTSVDGTQSHPEQLSKKRERNERYEPSVVKLGRFFKRGSEPFRTEGVLDRDIMLTLCVCAH